MQCPVDGETLVISERSGVEIDYCPKCRGVWLDRGELDKILDRADDFDRPRHEERAPYERDRDQRDKERYAKDHHDRSYKDRDYKDRDYRDDRHYDDSYHGHKKSRKKSFLSEIFEFGD